MTLIEQMKEVADATIKHYMTDFTIHDMRALEEIKKESGKYFLWSVDKSGTHLIALNDLYRNELLRGLYLSGFGSYDHYLGDVQAEKLAEVKPEKLLQVMTRTITLDELVLNQ